jgi:hypothetical protein
LLPIEFLGGNMNFFWFFWLLWFGTTLVARYYYRKNIDKRSLLISDKRFLQHYLLRPLFLLGEWDETSRSRRRTGGDQETISIMPRRLSDHFIVVPKKEEIAVPPGARLVIHKSGIASRCEVCHQTDRFDSGTGLCQRCNHRTV